MANDERRTGASRVPTGIAVFLGLQQGAIPLVARALFGREQRFALATRLPSPWWWITCLAVVAAAVAVVVTQEGARDRRAAGGDDGDGGGGGDVEEGAGADGPAGPDGRAGAGYEALSAAVFLAGIYNGVAPFVARLVFGGDLLLALPLRLPAPWWWITSLAVVVVAAVLLAVIDEAKQRHLSGG